MSNYVVDILTTFYRLSPPDGSCASQWKQHMIKIDNNGNVTISQNYMNCCSGCSSTYSGFSKLLEINDNIPIPVYLIPVIKQIFTDKYYYEGKTHFWEQPPSCSTYQNLYNEHWEIAINSLKLLKQELKQTTENPENILDIKNKLETYITKINLQEANASELEHKIENIQKAYFDTINDNKKMKDENKLLRDKITQLENEIKNRKDVEYINIPCETQLNSLKDCWSNPGGADIYTKHNATNRMVYNEYKGIYEPEEN
jgi:hypothetical protein